MDVGRKSSGISKHTLPQRRKQPVLMEMAGGGGASTLGWMRYNEDPCSLDFRHRLCFL